MINYHNSLNLDPNDDIFVSISSLFSYMDTSFFLVLEHKFTIFSERLHFVMPLYGTKISSSHLGYLGPYFLWPNLYGA